MQRVYRNSADNGVKAYGSMAEAGRQWVKAYGSMRERPADNGLNPTLTLDGRGKMDACGVC